MKKIFFSHLLIILGLTSWSLGGCTRSSTSSEASLKKENVLVMGLPADYPPFEFKKNGEIIGLVVELAREIAGELGYSLSIQDVDFSALIPSLQSGRIDFVMSGMTISEERKKNVDFSDVYFSSSFAMIVQQESPFAKEEDLTGKKVGVQLGSTMEKFAKEKAKLYPNMEVLALAKNPVLIQELKSRRVDGVVSEEVQAKAFVEANPGLRFVPLSSQTGDGYAIAFAQNNSKAAQLKEKFNSILGKFKVNGEMDQIKTKWLGQ